MHKPGDSKVCASVFKACLFTAQGCELFESNPGHWRGVMAFSSTLPLLRTHESSLYLYMTIFLYYYIASLL